MNDCICAADDGGNDGDDDTECDDGGVVSSPFRCLVQELFSQLCHQHQLLCFMQFRETMLMGAEL